MSCTSYLDCDECQDCINGECTNVIGVDQYGNEKCCISDGDCENCFECGSENKCESYDSMDGLGNSCCDGVFIPASTPYVCCTENKHVVIIDTSYSAKFCCAETYCDSVTEECAPEDELNSTQCLFISAGGINNRYKKNDYAHH